MRSLDWSQTPVGQVATWPQSLRTAVSICIGSRHPIEIWWGPQYVRFYNDAYRPILGTDKHPQFLGRPGRECWGEIWDQIGPMLDSVRATGVATWAEDYPLMMTRSGFVEETYFTFSYGPLRDESSGVGGIFCACTETTGRVHGERRLKLLRELSVRTAEAREAAEACRLAVDVLKSEPKDIAFASIYRIDDSRKTADLVASSGLPPQSTAAAKKIALVAHPGNNSNSDTLLWPFERAIRTNQAELVDDLEARFGVLPGGAWPEHAQAAYVLPLTLRSQSSPTWLLVVGISPRTPSGELYRDFCSQIAEQVCRAIADALALEAERKRAEEIAERERMERARLSDIFMQAPAFMGVLQGPQHIFELANPPYYQLVGHRDLIGKTVRDAFPDLAGQGFFELLDEVYSTGQTYVGKDVRVVLQSSPNSPPAERFVDLVYQPLRAADHSISGILAHGIDLTERRKVEQERERLFAMEHAAREELQAQQERQAVVVRYLRAANRASSQLMKADSQPEMIARILDMLTTDFRASMCGVWLATPDGRRLTLAGEHGLTNAASRSMEREIEVHLHPYKIGWVARFKRPFVSNDILSDMHFDKPWLEKYGVTAAAVLPLSHHDRLLGVLAAFFTEELPLEASAVLSTLASVLSANLASQMENSVGPDQA